MNKSYKMWKSKFFAGPKKADVELTFFKQRLYKNF